MAPWRLLEGTPSTVGIVYNAGIAMHEAAETAPAQIGAGHGCQKRQNLPTVSAYLKVYHEESLHNQHEPLN